MTPFDRGEQKLFAFTISQETKMAIDEIPCFTGPDREPGRIDV
jgi:hypothetical protein